MVDLGRVDIIAEVSLLASHLAQPREGHLEAVFIVVAYLNNKHNATMVFDPTYPVIDKGDFKRCDWRNVYGDVKEAIPPRLPKARGNDVDKRMFVDSDHGGEKLTRRSRTGYILYVNMPSVPGLVKDKVQWRPQSLGLNSWQ